MRKSKRCHATVRQPQAMAAGLSIPGIPASGSANFSPPSAAGPWTHWLSTEQIRKMQRMRRQTVIQAMNSGELPFEQRGRIRYARLADVLVWEQRRLSQTFIPSTYPIDPDFADLAG